VAQPCGRQTSGIRSPRSLLRRLDAGPSTR